MSLSGSLSDFSVLETLQLIGIQQKTGTLEIRSGRRRCSLHFKDGLLSGCRPSLEAGVDPFLQTLAGFGRCSRDEAKRLSGVTSSEELARNLSQVTQLSPEHLDALHRAVLQAALDRALLWDRGDFRFTPRVVAPEIRRPCPVDQALLETMRRLDEAADLKAGGLRLDAVPRRALQESPHLARPCNLGDAEDPVGEEIQRALLALSDGRRTLGELTDLFALAEYDVLSAARALDQAGLLLLEKTKVEAKSPEILLQAPVRGQRAAALAALSGIGLAALAIGAGIHLASQTSTRPPLAAALDQRQSFDTEREIRTVMEMARIRTGQRPQTLDELIALGLWPAKPSPAGRARLETVVRRVASEPSPPGR